MTEDKVRIAFVGRLKNALLYEFLCKKNWSQADLARELGVSQMAVSSWMLLKAVPRDEALIKKLEILLGQLREDIFPQFFQSDEWHEIRTKLPKKQSVIREVSVRMLIERSRLSLPSPEMEYDQKELHDCMERALLTLSPKQAEILRCRFGLGDKNEQTLQEVSEYFNVSPQRIRELENRALRKLKCTSKIERLLRPFLE